MTCLWVAELKGKAFRVIVAGTVKPSWQWSTTRFGRVRWTCGRVVRQRCRTGTIPEHSRCATCATCAHLRWDCWQMRILFPSKSFATSRWPWCQVSTRSLVADKGRGVDWRMFWRSHSASASVRQHCCRSDSSGLPVPPWSLHWAWMRCSPRHWSSSLRALFNLSYLSRPYVAVRKTLPRRVQSSPPLHDPCGHSCTMPSTVAIGTLPAVLSFRPCPCPCGTFQCVSISVSLLPLPWCVLRQVSELQDQRGRQ